MKLFEINEQSPLDWTMENLKLKGDFSEKTGYSRNEVDGNATFFSDGKFKGGADLHEFWVEPKRVITSPPYFITQCIGWVGKWKFVKNSSMKILNPTEIYVFDFDGTADEIKTYLSQFEAENVLVQFKSGKMKGFFDVLMNAKNETMKGFEVEAGPLCVYHYSHHDGIKILVDRVDTAEVQDEFELQDWLVNNGFQDLV